MRFLLLSLILFSSNIIYGQEKAQPELIIDAPTTAKTSEIILIDASKSNVDSLDYKAILVYRGAIYKIKVVAIENNTKAIIPPKPGRIFVTVSGCKDNVIKSEMVEIYVEDNASPDPDPGPDPKPIDDKYGMTMFVYKQAKKINKPDEAEILVSNLDEVLKQNHKDVADFTEAFMKLNREKVTVDMKERWNDFNEALASKLESLKLQDMAEHTIAYKEVKAGLERFINE